MKLIQKLKETLDKINETWGGNFEIEFIEKWKEIVKEERRKFQNCTFDYVW